MKRTDRLRLTGWLVLASGVLSGLTFYVMATRSAGPALDDTTALGYAKSLNHGMGVMMGRLGPLLTEWQEALTSPLGEASMIVIGAALLAGYFFRVAWVIGQDEQGGAQPERVAVEARKQS